jgi:predicted DCC family thiol-disulfide oxidoreductase YuxK
MKVKIFFDGNCIVCDMEISHYSRICPEVFELMDISQPDFNPKVYGFEFKDVNENMHILTENGEVKIGVDAFAYVWSKIPKYSIAGKIIKMPLVYQAAKVGYWVFAKNRHLLPKKIRPA